MHGGVPSHYGIAKKDDRLISVVIPDTVESIGNEAFINRQNLRKIVIPDSVKSIGGCAFSHCRGLADDKGFVVVKDTLYNYCGHSKDVVIPDGVVNIEKYSFHSRSDIRSIVFPDSVVNIGDAAFYECIGLERIVIPDSVTNIGINAFSDCRGLTDREGFVIVGNVLFDYVGDSADIVIPNHVTRIDDSAFRCCDPIRARVKSGTCNQDGVRVVIPDSVVSIGDEAFRDCRTVKRVEIPDSVKRIGDKAFYKCRSLSELIMSDGLDISMGKEVFGECTKLADSKGFVVVDGVLYDYYGEDTDIVIPDTVRRIDNSVFRDNENLKRVTVPDSVICIGECAFCNCDELTEVNFADSVLSIGEDAFSDCEKLERINIPTSLTVIRPHTFRNCESLRHIIVPDSVEAIEDGAFMGCEKLESISIPSSVKRIEFMAFEDCLHLAQITLPSDVKLGGRAFKGCHSLADRDGLVICSGILFDYRGNSARVVIPDSVITISEYAFEDCENIVSVIFPETVTSIGDNIFEGCGSLESVTVSGNISGFKGTVLEVLWDKFVTCVKNDYSILIDIYPYSKYMKMVLISSFLLAFTEEELKKKGLYEKIEAERQSIIKYAISYKRADVMARAISMFETISVDDLDEYMDLAADSPQCLAMLMSYINTYYTRWEQDDARRIREEKELGLRSYTDSELKKIFSYRKCDGGITVTGYLKDNPNVIIPEKIEGSPVVAIDDMAFSSAVDLLFTSRPINFLKKEIHSVLIPDSVERIGNKAFNGQRRLKYIDIPDSVKSIGNEAFRGCDGLADDKGLVIVQGVLYDYTGEDSMVIVPDSVVCIGASAFIGHTDIKEVVIPASVVEIASDAFKSFYVLRNNDFTICAPEGSYAEWYAVTEGITYKPLEE